MTNPVLNIPYQRAYSSAVEFNTQINEKQQGREQRYPKWTYPKRTFTLQFDKDPALRAGLEAFFTARKGNFEAFDWVWETSKGGNGETYTCNFDMDSLKENLHHLGYAECELKLLTIDRNPVTPVSEFNFYYKTKYKFSMAFNNLVDKVFTAQNNRRALWTAPKKSWELVFDKDPETRKQIEDFFIAKRGKFKAFQWIWETAKGGDGQTYWVRFDTDNLNFDMYLGYADNITIPIKEVWRPPVQPDSDYEKDEIIPRRLLKIDIPTGAVNILDNETMTSLNYNGDTYLGAPLDIGDLVKNDNTEVSRVKATVSNVGQGISSIIGQHGDVITNCDCYLYQVLLNTSTFSIISGSEQLLYFGKANNLYLDIQNASIDIETTLGGFEKQAPVMSYGCSCQWLKFKDAKCGYTGSQTTCDRTLITCKTYGNIENFGGFPNLPKQQIIKV